MRRFLTYLALMGLLIQVAFSADEQPRHSQGGSTAAFGETNENQNAQRSIDPLNRSFYTCL